MPPAEWRFVDGRRKGGRVTVSNGAHALEARDIFSGTTGPIAELSVWLHRLSNMPKKNEKRAEWEKLLLGNRAPLSGDPPEELLKLLEQLDERLRGGGAPDAA